MFARVTHYKMKADSAGEATAIMNSIKSKIMALPGIRQFINVADKDGRGYVVSLYESQGLAESGMAQVGEIWANFGKHLEGPPKLEGYEVTANWTK